MSHHAHHAAAGQRSVNVHLVVVSSTRTLETDRSGPALREALGQSGHRIVGSEILPDDAQRISDRLLELRDDPLTQAVVLTGGTGISRNDGTFEAVRATLDRVLPGFGEIFRRLSYDQIGAAAMLSRAIGGVTGQLIVFAIPGSPAACTLAGEMLIGPELGHLVYELGKELPADEGTEGGISMSLDSPLPVAPPEVTPPAPGWSRKLTLMGGSLDRERRLDPPGSLLGVAAAAEVLAGAGESGFVSLPEGEYAAYGFPDLRRPESKVLLIGEGAPYGEIVALHRWPMVTGVAREGGGVVWSTGRMGRTAEELTGHDYPGEGKLFAVDGNTVYVLEDGAVVKWDGQRQVPQGPPASVLASLLLRWSQR